VKVRNLILLAIPVAVSIPLGMQLLSSVNSSMPEPPEGAVSIIAVGDSIGYNVDEAKLSHLGEMMGSTDIFIFNLEGSLVDSGEQAKECKGFPEVQSIFASSPAFIKHMKLAPVTIANMGNNHVLDCGAEGIERTKKILSEDNILFLGAGQNLDESCEPLFVENKGMRMALFSYNLVMPELFASGPDKAGAARPDGCKHDYKSKAEDAELVIASVHVGRWSADVNATQVELVNRLFDSGVDIVIGHSPHIPQAVMVRDGKLAFFSLGNFILRPDYTMPALAYTTSAKDRHS
jgi:poly-gamma-glutamate synthesis protein (capsule biosynthesis protein)